MSIFALEDELIFPAPHLAEETGLLAVGGDLSPSRLLLAYSCGIFPWNHPEDPILWWSPDPRCVLDPSEVHISRRLAKKIRQRHFTIRYDTDFSACIHHCAHADERLDSTWISPQIIAAYQELHHLGYAHSVECWEEDQMVGGLYGIAIGRCFCGESMFHTRTDASKLAFTALAQALKQLGYRMIDCQLPTDHLHSLGAKDIPREQFLRQLQACQVRENGYIVPGRFPLPGPATDNMSAT
ncbi:MAG: leucyl/phenylalanyl-tRNA--protein transferase [Desulfuromonas sp.]|nr:MAG: leucyl/phenylalanyl-tRNA--protein transferase [Desulfuromonas sp.]